MACDLTMLERILIFVQNFRIKTTRLAFLVSFSFNIIFIYSSKLSIVRNLEKLICLTVLVE